MISKAKKIDSDEEVEGYLIDKEKISIELDSDYEVFSGYYSAVIDYYLIDPSTLKHSFDNGKTWRTEEEINSDLLAMDALRRLKDK